VSEDVYFKVGQMMFEQNDKLVEMQEVIAKLAEALETCQVVASYDGFPALTYDEIKVDKALQLAEPYLRGK